MALALVGAFLQLPLATNTECQLTEEGVWTCDDVAWEEAGITVPRNVTVWTPGDSAEVTVNTDFNSTTMRSASTSPDVTIIETKDEQITIVPRLNLVKIERNGTTEHMLASDDPDARYKLGPNLTTVPVVRENTTTPPTTTQDCKVRVLWEGYWSYADPGASDVRPEATARIYGEWVMWNDLDNVSDQGEIDVNESVSASDGSLDPGPVSANPVLLSGNRTWEFNGSEFEEDRELVVDLTLEVDGWGEESKQLVIHRPNTEECVGTEES